MKKNIILGITGSIAAYKSADIASKLSKRYNVNVVMTNNAQKFINPLTFSSLTNNNVYSDLFKNDENFNINHIKLAMDSDYILIAPATANIIAKLANGIADDLLSTITLAFDDFNKIIIAPAMNVNMYNNIITQNNIKKLKSLGVQFIEPSEGLLACGIYGKGKLAPVEDIIDFIEFKINTNNMLKGKKVLITAGPTIESIDPVRYLTNNSTGKMGYSLAYELALYGADVTLISGTVNIKAPYGVNKIIYTKSAEDMYNEVIKLVPNMDIIIKTAAVADFTPIEYMNNKIKKENNNDNISIKLRRTKDILLEISKIRNDNQIVIGFAAESENLIENAENKLKRKKLDYIVANDISNKNIGFGSNNNEVTIISKNGNHHKIDISSKKDISKEIIKYCLL